MNQKPEQPAYRAAAETALVELRQISDRLSQLRLRQEQICTAVQALKLLAGAQESAASANAGQSVYPMNGRSVQSGKEAVKVKALA